jgi:hypothetical protein
MIGGVDELEVRGGGEFGDEVAGFDEDGASSRWRFDFVGADEVDLVRNLMKHVWVFLLTAAV